MKLHHYGKWTEVYPKDSGIRYLKGWLTFDEVELIYPFHYDALHVINNDYKSFIERYQESSDNESV